MNAAHLALGSNLGDSPAAIGRALSSALAELGTVVARSALYRTPPLGPPQPDYVNAAAALETALAPEQLLPALKAIERALGRTPGPRWGPRLIDLDLLLCGERVVKLPGLTLPHPELHKRAFVLVPLCEIAPDLRHPLLGRPERAIGDALTAAERAAIVRLDTLHPGG